MPQMADITIKKADGATDITYTALTPSAGDKTSAIWAPSTVGTGRGFRPELRVSSHPNAARTVRYVNGIIAWPVVETIGGTPTVTNRNSVSFQCLTAEKSPDSDIDEMVEQAVNLLRSSLMREAMKTGYSPT